MSDVAIRDATEADVDGVRAVATGAWPETYAGLLSPRTIERALEEWYALPVVVDRVAENLFRVAEDGDTIVGFADVRRPGPAAADEAADEAADGRAGDAADAPADEVDGATGAQPDDAAKLAALYVPPSHQRRGIGTALLDDAEATLREEGTEVLLTRVLAGNERALAFYRERGFERRDVASGELFDEPVEEVVLERTL